MATRPSPTGRSTEIDIADDLFKEEGSAAAEPEAEKKPGLERDNLPVDVGKAPEKERPPLVEPEKAPAAAKAGADDLEGTAAGAGRRERKPSALLYFGVPAAGAALILGLGWTFAFIIRQGLVTRAEAPKQVQQARVLPPKKGVKAPAPTPKDARETLKKLLPTGKEPVQPSTAPGGKGDETGGGKVSLDEPFFIPLEGGRRNGARNPTVFLHLSLTLNLSNQAAMREVAGKRSVIRELIFNHFNRLSPRDLLTPKGRERIKASLVAKLSKEVVQGQVRAVYFEEFFTR